MTATPSTPAERVANFLANHRSRNGADPELIIQVHADPDLAPGQLLASDLDALLAERTYREDLLRRVIAAAHDVAAMPSEHLDEVMAELA